jgi:NADPH:quinone reductase-like Zn-dependent oxidoreductase
MRICPAAAFRSAPRCAKPHAAARQVAKALGAKVTAVCSGHEAQLADTLGADRIVDYTEAIALGDGASADDAREAWGGLGTALRAVVEAVGRPFDLCLDTVTSAEVVPWLQK